MKIIFVDGYNVINSWPNLNGMREYSFDGARNKLHDILVNYASYNNCRIYLVFDGHKVAGNIEKVYEEKFVTTVFTKFEQTADSYIEKKVNDIGRRAEIIVVTSDWLEQQTIFQRGAVRMSSLEFYNDVLKSEEKIDKRMKKNYVKNRNLLSDSVGDEILAKLERMRRGR